MTDAPKKWTIWTSIHLFEYCANSWRNHMWNGEYPDKNRMRDLFWWYLNYGHNPHKTFDDT